MNKDCIFCKIVKGTIPAEIAYEDKFTLAFMDINPVNPGHMLLIPKKHEPSLIESSDDTVKKVFLRVKKLMPILKKVTKADFVAISVVGNEVPHLHVHLIPRWQKDGLANFWPKKEVKSEIRAKIAKEILSLSKNI